MEKEKKGKLIYICGIDGAGKTTLAKKLARKEENSKYLSVSELSFFTNQIRKGDKDSYRSRYDPYFRGVQWALDMLQMSNNSIEPLINKGTNVFIDRYYLCNLAYTKIRNKKQFQLLMQIYTNMIKPDKIFWLDVDPIIAHKRIEKRKKKIEPKENIKQMFLARKKYKNFSLWLKNEIVVLDSLTIKESIEIIEKYIKGNKL